jgi:hypothetical protein
VLRWLKDNDDQVKKQLESVLADFEHEFCCRNISDHLKAVNALQSFKELPKFIKQHFIVSKKGHIHSELLMKGKKSKGHHVFVLSDAMKALISRTFLGKDQLQTLQASLMDSSLQGFFLKGMHLSIVDVLERAIQLTNKGRKQAAIAAADDILIILCNYSKLPDGSTLPDIQVTMCTARAGNCKYCIT